MKRFKSLWPIINFLLFDVRLVVFEVVEMLRYDASSMYIIVDADEATLSTPHDLCGS